MPQHPGEDNKPQTAPVGKGKEQGMSQLCTCHWLTLRCQNDISAAPLSGSLGPTPAVVAGPAALVLPSLLWLHYPDLLNGQIFLVSSTNQGNLRPRWSHRLF